MSAGRLAFPIWSGRIRWWRCQRIRLAMARALAGALAVGAGDASSANGEGITTMPTELRPERAYQAQVLERMGVAALVDLAAQEPDQEITLSIDRADFAEDASRYPAAIYVWPADALSYDGGSLVLHLSAALPDTETTVAPLWVGMPRLAIEGKEIFCKLELAGWARLRHQWLYSRHPSTRTILIDGELAPEPHDVKIFHAVALTEPATRLITSQAAEEIRLPLEQTALRALAAADLAEDLVVELDRA